jgi:hypothetical protein
MKARLIRLSNLRDIAIHALVGGLILGILPTSAFSESLESIRTGPIVTMGFGFSKSMMEDDPRGSFCGQLTLSRFISKSFLVSVESSYCMLGEQNIGTIEDEIVGELKIYERLDLIPITINMNRVVYIHGLGSARISIGLGSYYLGRDLKVGYDSDLGPTMPDGKCFGGTIGVDLFLGHLSRELNLGSGFRWHWFSKDDERMSVMTILVELYWR